MQQSPTTFLGRYRLLLELGHGGMAHVYLALVTGLAGFSKLVVLKVMRDELREHPESLSMFLGEARLAARMNHANVVQTSEVGEDGGRYFICMEYLEGQPLSRVLRKTVEFALPLGARLEIVCQMLEGLSYLHNFTDLDGTPLHLVHRDISPNNIFVTFDGRIKVLDFGIAKAAGISHVTESGTFKGKLGYAAPEQIVGRSDQRSDVFAAGVLFWEMLAYRRLTQDRTQTEIVRGRIAGGESQLMLQHSADVPPQLMEICAKATAQEPEDRYATAAEMCQAIREYAAERSLEFPPDKLRDLMSRLYQSERTEMRRQIDQRMKQVQLEDEHPSLMPNAPFVPTAAPVFGGTMTEAALSNHPPQPVGRGKLLLVGLAVALVAGGVGASLTRLGPHQAETASASAPHASAAASAAAAAPSAELVSLRVTATPPAAEILLDGAKLEGNPFSGQLTRDTALHRLEVRAPGHKSEARMIHLEQDSALSIDLTAITPATPAIVTEPGPELVPVRGRARSSRTTDTPSAGSDSAPTAPPDDFVHRSRDKKTARPIDNSDPYGP